MENVFCSKCGKQAEEGTSFCSKCGNVLSDQSNSSVYTTPIDNATNINQDNNYSNYSSPFSPAQPQINPYAPLHKVRCKNCKTEFTGLTVCPNCHSNNINTKPHLWIGILALVFAVSGSMIGGIPLGIVGIISANKTGYKPLKIMSIVAIPMCIFLWIFWTIFWTAIKNNL